MCCIGSWELMELMRVGKGVVNGGAKGSTMGGGPKGLQRWCESCRKGARRLVRKGEGSVTACAEDEYYTMYTK